MHKHFSRSGDISIGISGWTVVPASVAGCNLREFQNASRCSYVSKSEMNEQLVQQWFPFKWEGSLKNRFGFKITFLHILFKNFPKTNFILRWKWSMVCIVPFNVNGIVTSGVAADVHSFPTSHRQWSIWIKDDFRQLWGREFFAFQLKT